MKYFEDLAKLLDIEYQEDLQQYQLLMEQKSVHSRKEMGITWFPIIIKNEELGAGDYLQLEIERPQVDIPHKFRFGMPVELFSNHAPQTDRLKGTIAYVNQQKMRISFRTEELPEWCENGKLGVNLLFDENSYKEMRAALKTANEIKEHAHKGLLTRILTGIEAPQLYPRKVNLSNLQLNEKQKEAVKNIVDAEQLSIVHGPPGTGKTTTLVAAIEQLLAQEVGTILVTAPSNTAVDLLTEKLDAKGIEVTRIGNPVRVNERLQDLTYEQKILQHPDAKEIKKLKKQAAAYLDMAHKYKRSFGAAEREQRKALFKEARQILADVEHIQSEIARSVIRNTQVIAATLVGANHPSIQHVYFDVVIIDEAGQANEPSCWIPIVKAKKIILAGDHQQLPPTIKSVKAEKEGLGITLLEKLVKIHPSSVIMLEEQYRMNEKIMQFSSEQFYHHQLKAAPANATHSLDKHPFLFIDTAGAGFEEKVEENAISNPEEAAFVLQFIGQWMENNSFENPPSIGLISPYRKQVKLFDELLSTYPNLEKNKELITIQTIDSFQGQERDAIFISLTRSNTDQKIGFLNELRRINVAMTRAKKKLVIIGDSSTLSQHKFYNDLMDYAEKENAYKSCWEFMM